MVTTLSSASVKDKVTVAVRFEAVLVFGEQVKPTALAVISPFVSQSPPEVTLAVTLPLPLSMVYSIAPEVALKAIFTLLALIDGVVLPPDEYTTSTLSMIIRFDELAIEKDAMFSAFVIVKLVELEKSDEEYVFEVLVIAEFEGAFDSELLL